MGEDGGMGWGCTFGSFVPAKPLAREGLVCSRESSIHENNMSYSSFFFLLPLPSSRLKNELVFFVVPPVHPSISSAWMDVMELAFDDPWISPGLRPA